jgi:CRP-like cAMP-binding protein
MKPLSLIEKAFFLKKVRLFADLDLDLLLAIAEKLHHDDYNKDERVFSSGQPANRMYLILQGSVQILDDKLKIVNELTSHDAFGDESLFNEAPRAYSALCKNDTEFLTLSRSHLLSILAECPSVSVALLQSYAHKLPCRL